MCMRIAYHKVLPGDLVWCTMEKMDEGVPLYFDEEAGANPDDTRIVDRVDYGTTCLVLAMDKERMHLLVMGREGRYGWTHRILWERAGTTEPEYEVQVGEDGWEPL